MEEKKEMEVMEEMEDSGDLEERSGKPEIMSGAGRRTAGLNGMSKQNWIKGSGSGNEYQENQEKPSRKAAWNNYFKFKIYVQKIEE